MSRVVWSQLLRRCTARTQRPVVLEIRPVSGVGTGDPAWNGFVVEFLGMKWGLFSEARPGPGLVGRIWRSSHAKPGGILRRGPRMSTAAAKDQETSNEGLVITESCVKRLKEIQSEAGPEGRKQMLRLSVDGGGCSGFLYSFSLDDTVKPDDRVFERDGVKVIVDEISFSFVKGATADYSEELIRASFTVSSNPNAASGCGCGASFTAK